MGMQNPTVRIPLDKFSEKIKEGEAFFLESIRTVKSKTANYGEGEMVVVKVRGFERELGIWGSYLLTQAKSVEAGDLNRWYKLEREKIAGFGKGDNPVKVFKPTDIPAANS